MRAQRLGHVFVTSTEAALLASKLLAAAVLAAGLDLVEPAGWALQWSPLLALAAHAVEGPRWQLLPVYMLFIERWVGGPWADGWRLLTTVVAGAVAVLFLALFPLPPLLKRPGFTSTAAPDKFPVVFLSHGLAGTR